LPIRVLIINTVPTEKNGITKVIFNLMNAIDWQNVIFDLVSINSPRFEYMKDIEKQGGEIYIFERGIKHLIKYIWRLIRLIKIKKYDIVHAHGNSSTLALEMCSAKLAGCKVRIAHSHNTTCKYKILHIILKQLLIATCTDRFACGIDAGKWLYNSHYFTVIKNGIDTNKYYFNSINRNLIRDKYGISNNDELIGHIGNFIEVKNHAFLIEIFNRIVKEKVSYKLMLVGDGPLLPKIKKKVIDLNLHDLVIFIGATDEVHKFLSAFDIIIMPSFYEGIPLSLIEGQANGLVCLASDKISKEVDITGNVIFISLNDTNMWIKKVNEIRSPINRINASEIAKKKIEDTGYNIKQEAKKVSNYYNEVNRFNYS